MKIQYIPGINLPGGKPIPNSKYAESKQITADRSEEEPFDDVLLLRLSLDNYCGALPSWKNALTLSGAKPCHMNRS